MNIQPLSVWDLAIASSLVIILALLNLRSAPHLSKSLLIAMARLIVQLALIGLVLEWVFQERDPLWLALIAIVMVLLAGREVSARQRFRFRRGITFWAGTFSMFVSSLVLCVFALAVLVQVDPWYKPQYAIPMLGMLLGNSLNGISISLDRITEAARLQRPMIEARLLLGHTPSQAIAGPRRQALNSALIPTINSMAAAGIISLPGMMTGQILAGASPKMAVSYQILIFLLIAAGTGLGTMLATQIAIWNLFDKRARLSTDRLRDTTINSL